MNISKRKIRIERLASCGYVVVFSLAVQALMVRSAVAQNESEKKTAKPKIEFLECKVRVTDPDGNPIENATVSCTVVGSSGQNRKFFRWSYHEAQFGPVPHVQTNKDGIANVPYPKYFRLKMEATQLDFRVQHEDFVTSDCGRVIEDAPSEIQLQRGFRVAITAVNSVTGQQIKEDLYVDSNGKPDWELKKNGTLVSSVLPKREFYLRLMQCTEGQPTLFSEMITVAPGKTSRVLLRDVELSPGTRLEGKLDASVKRPIKNGFIAGHAVNQKDDYWSWSDVVKIEEDGSFVFESLPRDFVWQMIPFCDGWISAEPKFESIVQHFPKRLQLGNLDNEASTSSIYPPQLTKLSGDQASVRLKMIPLASVSATFVGPNDKPVGAVRAMLKSTKRFHWLDGDHAYLASPRCTKDLMVAKRRKEKTISDMPKSNLLNGGSLVTSNANGVCEIRNLPPMTRIQLQPFHPRLVVQDANEQGKFDFELKAGEQKELTIKLQARE